VSSVVELERSGAERSSALARCTGDAAAFLEQTWGRRALVHPSADARGFADLLTLDDVDRLLSTTSLRTPSFRLVKAGESIPDSAYTRSGTTGGKPVRGIADPARVFERFRDGATIVLQGLHRYHEPVARFVRDLELELGHPCQVNAYITPPGAQGLELHSDGHDVFVLQAFGSKSWEVHAAPREDDREPIHAEVASGDTIYMPEGTPHAARAQETVSGHLTVGVHVTPWRELVSAAFRRVLSDPSFDERVPAGWTADPTALVRALEPRVAAAGEELTSADVDEVVSDRWVSFLSSRAPLLRGGLVDQLELERITDDSLLERRPGSVLVIRTLQDRLLVLLGDRRLEMPPWLEPAMLRVAAQERFRPVDLEASVPDEASRLVLVRRLVREGLLQMAGSGHPSA
jgi:bifunctional lysine-specific demethylase and histidyl-hydroxylase NO66